jgi:hypothetical protein
MRAASFHRDVHVHSNQSRNDWASQSRSARKSRKGSPMQFTLFR